MEPRSGARPPITIRLVLAVTVAVLASARGSSKPSVCDHPKSDFASASKSKCQ